MFFEKKEDTKEPKYLSNSLDYQRAKNRLDYFLKKACLIYMSKKRDLFPDLMSVKADMVVWERELPDKIRSKIKRHKLYMFIKRIMEDDIVAYLEKYLR